jgi:hypothetical protein
MEAIYECSEVEGLTSWSGTSSHENDTHFRNLGNSRKVNILG